MIQNLKAVVFDMDGVVLDTEKLIFSCSKEVAKQEHISDIEDVLYACLGTTNAETKRIFLEKYGDDFAFDEYQEKMRALFFAQNIPVKTGVKELFEAIHANGVKMALASSTRSVVVKKQLADAGVIDYFDCLICGDMVQNSKPDPEIFLKACEMLGENPSDCYGIEDSYNGIRSVSAAGMHPIMVPDLLEPTDEMRTLSEVILPSLVEVKQYLFD